MMAGRVDGAGVLAGVAGTVAGATGLGVVAAGSAALGAMTGGLDSTRGVGIASLDTSVDSGGGDAASSSGTGVYASKDASGSNGRRGRFFLRGGLI